MRHIPILLGLTLALAGPRPAEAQVSVSDPNEITDGVRYPVLLGSAGDDFTGLHQETGFEHPLDMASGRPAEAVCAHEGAIARRSDGFLWLGDDELPLIGMGSFRLTHDGNLPVLAAEVQTATPGVWSVLTYDGITRQFPQTGSQRNPSASGRWVAYEEHGLPAYQQCVGPEVVVADRTGAIVDRFPGATQPDVRDAGGAPLAVFLIESDRVVMTSEGFHLQWGCPLLRPRLSPSGQVVLFTALCDPQSGANLVVWHPATDEVQELGAIDMPDPNGPLTYDINDDTLIYTLNGVLYARDYQEY